MDAFVQSCATCRTSRRTAKSCGPGAAMLASSLRKLSAGDGDNKPAHRGERDISRKAIAQGMSVCSPLTCMLVCAFFALLAHETAGAARTRHSLRPLFKRGTTNLENLGANYVARTRTHVFPRRRHGASPESIYAAIARKPLIISRSHVIVGSGPRFVGLTPKSLPIDTVVLCYQVPRPFAGPATESPGRFIQRYLAAACLAACLRSIGWISMARRRPRRSTSIPACGRCGRGRVRGSGRRRR